jgi:membrane-bound lytic murein transglycosylase D
MVFQQLTLAQSDANYSTANFNFSTGEMFPNSYANLNSSLFSELQTGAEILYDSLNVLKLAEKQNLVRNFYEFKSFAEGLMTKEGLPLELLYLAPALSKMNTEWVSGKGRVGLWQLSHFQGSLNGLQINRLVDERFNSKMATQAAILQLKQNVEAFKDVELAVIAYLVGNTKLKNTLVRCGDATSVSNVLEQLPKSVSETVAAFQAMSVFFSLNKFQPNDSTLLPDWVAVNRQVHFNQIAQVLNIREDQLRELNPEYRFSIIPGDKKTMYLSIPNGKGDDYALWIDSIYSAYDSTLFQVVAQNIEYPPAPTRQYLGEKVKDLEIEGKTKLKYTIKSGDVLGFIAEAYDVRVADLKYWNNIYNERKIQVGQKLDIFVDDDQAEYYSGLQKKPSEKKESSDVLAQLPGNFPIPVYQIPKSAKRVEHIVKSGESPYVIAKKYKGVTPEQILEWNGIQDARKIQIGQKLVIYLEK